MISDAQAMGPLIQLHGAKRMYSSLRGRRSNSTPSSKKESIRKIENESDEDDLARTSTSLPLAYEPLRYTVDRVEEFSGKKAHFEAVTISIQDVARGIFS